MQPSYIKGIAITIVFATLIGGFVVFYTSGRTGDIPLSLLKDVLFFVFSAFLSYLLATAVSKSEYKKELHKLGNISVRRVGRLSENIREIAKGLEATDEQHANELFRIARDADESTADILLITDTERGSRHSEIIFCPHCGFKDAVSVPENIGGSSKATCRGCSQPYNVHRVTNGVKIVPIEYRQRENQLNQHDKVDITCPNNDCGEHIYIRHEDGSKKLMCFNCKTSFNYDFGTSSASDLVYNDIADCKKSIKDIRRLGSIICPTVDCMYNIPESAFCIRNRYGEYFARCKECGTTIISKKSHATK